MYHHGLADIGAWISNHIHHYMWDAITNAYSIMHGGLTKSSQVLGHGWLITSYCNLSMYEHMLGLQDDIIRLYLLF